MIEIRNEIPRDKNGKTLESALIVKAEVNCNDPPKIVSGRLLKIGLKISVIASEGRDIHEVENSKIEITDFK